MTVEQVTRPATRAKGRNLPSLAEQPRVELIRSLAGRVYLDRAAGTASKLYVPPFIVKLLYWLAFQAPFPYVRNLFALRAAEARRKIAGLFTRFWFGRDLVAPVLAIDCDSKGCVYVTRLVEGGPPQDKKRARAFLAEVSKRFAEVGLPTWQVNPFNPRSPDNLIETSDGSYRIIDLESAVVSPILPLRQWLDALRAGSVPVFDDVFVARTRRYVHDHADVLRQSLGPQGLLELEKAIGCYQECAAQWRNAELRLWSRLLRALIATARGGARMLGLFRLASAVAGALRQARQGGQRADAWVREGINRMRDEGRLDAEGVRKAEASLKSPETLSAMTHLGAHTAMSVPLRFPFGSIGRFLWTLAFRLATEWRAIVRRQDDESVRSARRIHTLPVMLLSALPGAGAVAYVAAEPLRENRPLLGVLVDQASRKLPLRLYERFHVPALTCWIACSAAPRAEAGTTKRRLRLPRLGDLTRVVRSGLRSITPYRTLMAFILAFNVGAAALALGVDVARGSFGSSFHEFGPIQSLYAIELLLIGVLGHRIFFRFWQRSDASTSPDAPGIFFWLISGWGFAWLSIDNYFGVHERLGDWLTAHGGVIPLLNHVDDGIVLFYGVVGLGLVYLFYGHLRASGASFTLLLLGLFWTGVYMAVDFFAPHGSLLAGAEEPANLMANAFLLTAYLVKYKQVAPVVRLVGHIPAASSEAAAGASRYGAR